MMKQIKQKQSIHSIRESFDPNRSFQPEDTYYANIDLKVNNLFKINENNAHQEMIMYKFDEGNVKPCLSRTKSFKKISIVMSSAQIALKKNLKPTESNSNSISMSRTSFLNKSQKLSKTSCDHSFDLSSSKTSYFRVKNNNAVDQLNESSTSKTLGNSSSATSRYFSMGNVAGQKIRRLVKKYF